MFFEVGLTIFAHLLIASFDYLILHTLDMKDSDSSLYLLQTFFFWEFFIMLHYPTYLHFQVIFSQAPLVFSSMVSFYFFET